MAVIDLCFQSKSYTEDNKLSKDIFAECLILFEQTKIRKACKGRVIFYQLGGGAVIFRGGGSEIFW